MSWNYTQQPQVMQGHYQQNHPQYVQQQQCQQSQHYGDYGQYYQKNVFEMNAWQGTTICWDLPGPVPMVIWGLLFAGTCSYGDAYNMSSEDKLASLFGTYVSSSEANMLSNGIQSEDLRNILNQTQSIRDYYGINWSRELCSVLMAMLDRNPDGFMQWPEFMELQKCLLAWYNMFRQHDTNRSNYIEACELSNVIKVFGYRISKEMLTTLLKRYSRAQVVDGQVQTLIAFDDFVSLCVRIRAYTDAFRKRDRLCHGGGETGDCTFNYDDFLQCVMCL